MRSASSTSRCSSAIRMLVTVYLSTLYLNGCQLLCKARANNPHSYRFRSPPICFYSRNLFPLAFVGFRSPDFGTHSRTLTTQLSPCLAVPSVNTYVYLAGEPESGGHPIGRRSVA